MSSRQAREIEGIAGFYHTASADDRRTLVLALAYQQLRREAGEYVTLFTDYEAIQNSRTFRTFETVRKWLELEHWRITHKQPAWFGYLKYVFDSMAPRIPHPAQLRNQKLKNEYLQRGVRAASPKPVRNADELRKLYGKIMVNVPDGFVGVGVA